MFCSREPSIFLPSAARLGEKSGLYPELQQERNQVPAGLMQELRHKAAGHDGTLTDKDELLIFKPAVRQELNFYKAIQERMFDDSKSIKEDVPLYSWMPRFLGVLDHGIQETSKGPEVLNTSVVAGGSKSGTEGKIDKRFIVLENLLHGFSEPNVLDVKLGKVLHDDSASEEKRERLRQISRTTTSGCLGFRVCGMKMKQNRLTQQLDPLHHEKDADNYLFLNKMYGRTLTEGNIEDAFSMFFANDHLSFKRVQQLKHIFLQRLQLIFNTLLDEEVRIISGSLLFIYEGDSDRWDSLNDQDSLLRDDFIQSDEESESEDETNVKTSTLSSMSLIDFAHAKLVPGEGYDENVVEAIENLIVLFKNLCRKSI